MLTHSCHTVDGAIDASASASHDAHKLLHAHKIVPDTATVLLSHEPLLACRHRSAQALVQFTCLCQQVQEGVAAGPRQPELQFIQDDALHAQDVMRLQGQHSTAQHVSSVP